VVVARGFGAAESGAFFEAVSVATILVILAQIGTLDAIVWRSSDRGAGLGAGARDALAMAFLPVAALSLVGCCILLVVAPTLAALLTSARLQDELSQNLRVLALTIPATALTGVLLAYSRGAGHMGATNAVEYIAKPIGRLLLAVLAAIAVSRYLLLGSWIVPAVAGILGTIGILFRGRLPLGLLRTGRWERTFWRYSTLRGVAAASQSLILWLDLLIVGALLRPREVGTYAAISRYAVALGLPLAACAMAVAPLLSDALARGGLSPSVVYQKTCVWLTLISAPICTVVAVFAEPLLRIFGSSFTAGTPALRVTAAAALINSATGPLATVVLMGGKSGINLAVSVIGLATNVAASVVLVSAFGLVGASIAWALTIVVTNGLGLWIVDTRWSVGVPIGRISQIWMLVAAIIAIPSTVAVSLAGTGAGVIVCALGLAIYGALVTRSGCDWAVLTAVERPREVT
jgi:O-antigen/teichoic acid export membrane protein